MFVDLAGVNFVLFSNSDDSVLKKVYDEKLILG